MISRSWTHVHFFLQISIEEGIVYIHLVYWLILSNYNRKQGPDNDHLGNECKYFSKIYTFLLSVAKNDKACLISLNGSIRLIFDFIDPFAPQCMLSCGQFCQFSSSILLKSMNFLLYCFTPFKAGYCLRVSIWLCGCSNNRC